MRKHLFLAIMSCTLCGLCAMSALCSCEKQPTETAEDTNAGTEQAITTDSGTMSTTAAESSTNNTTSCESSTDNNVLEDNIQVQIKEASYSELTGILDEINTDIKPEADGNEAASIKAAAHLLNWGVGTSLRTDEIKEKTAEWLSDMGDSEQADFSRKLAAVYDSYKKLIGPNAEELLEDAGCEDAAYPWSDSPVETIEAIIEAAELPADAATSDESTRENGSGSEHSGPDVAELVNLRGDTTTVYLLEDGRYMNRSEEVFIYDGIDTWTDESGVEWNETVN